MRDARVAEWYVTEAFTAPIHPSRSNEKTLYMLPRPPKMAHAFGRYPQTALHFSAWAFVYLALVLPNRLSLITTQAWACLPLEGLLLGLALLVTSRYDELIRASAAAVLTMGILLKAADMATYQLFDRAFNPLLDARFPADGMNFLQGTLGKVGAVMVAVLLVALLLGLLFLVHGLLGTLQRRLRHSSKTALSGLLAGLLLWTVGAWAGWHIAATPFYQLQSQHLNNTLSSIADLEQFEAVVDNDPYAAVACDRLFDTLQGKDVLVVFVESYGKTVLDKADYAAQIRPLLAQSSAELATQGWQARSAFLTSPTYGGISWLAHGTLMSGLWINSQTRYDRLVMSQRPTLNRLFHRAGWRTVALQPAHTMDWPQGAYFGYDQIYSARDLGYQGQSFNWITMPDQYVLSALQRLERKPGPRQAVMAEIALISSHAPWTPLPRQVEWDQVGDGSVFTQARAGDTPEVVWQNTERIREQYRQSIAYALANIVSFVKHYGDDNLVLLVLGDHQPAPFVSAESASHDVLVHLISRDSQVMAAVNAWQWTAGMLPAATAPVWGMDQMRERFIAAFSKKI